MLTSAYGIPVVIIYSLSRDRVRNCYLFWLGFGPGLGFGFQLAPLSVWPHLFRGAGHEKRRGEQLKWSLAFRLYMEVFQVHGYQDQFIQPGWAECVFCAFSLVLYFVYSFVFL